MAEPQEGGPSEAVLAVRGKLTSLKQSLNSQKVQMETSLDQLTRLHRTIKETNAKIAELQKWLVDNGEKPDE